MPRNPPTIGNMIWLCRDLVNSTTFRFSSEMRWIKVANVTTRREICRLESYISSIDVYLSTPIKIVIHLQQIRR